MRVQVDPLMLVNGKPLYVGQSFFMRPSIIVGCLAVALIVQGCATKSEDYPPAFGQLILAKANACPDISGRYQANRNLLSLFRTAEEGQVVSIFSPELRSVSVADFSSENHNTIGFKFYSEGSSAYTGKLSKDAQYWCDEGMIAIRYESVSMSLTPGIVGFGTDTFYIARTTAKELVAKRVIKGTPMLLILPMPGGKHEVSWIRWKPAPPVPTE